MTETNGHEKCHSIWHFALLILSLLIIIDVFALNTLNWESINWENKDRVLFLFLVLANAWIVALFISLADHVQGEEFALGGP